MSADGDVDIRRAEPLEPEEALAVVSESFGISVSEPVTLGGEFDQNLRVTDSTGGHYLVKVSTLADDDPTTATWHERILLHLQQKAPDLPLPRLIPALDGSRHVVTDTSRGERMFRVLTWLTGESLSEEEPHSDELLTELGEVAGMVSTTLATMPEPHPTGITHDWDMRRARDVVDISIGAVDDAERRADIDEVMRWFDTVAPMLSGLPRGVAHQDLNDSNILVTRDAEGRQRISGVLDINDALYTARVAELAVATAYGMVRKNDPLQVAQLVVAGFDSVTPLTDDELAVVFPLAAARLAMNATTWTHRNANRHNDHGVKRMAHTWPALAKVARIDPDYAEAALRVACGRPAHPDTARVTAALEPIAPLDLGSVVIDTSPTSDLLDGIDWQDPVALRRTIDGVRGADVGVIGHLQTHLPWARQRGVGEQEPATITVGVRLLSSERLTLPPGAVVDGDEAVLRHDLFQIHWRGLDSGDVSVALSLS